VDNHGCIRCGARFSFCRLWRVGDHRHEAGGRGLELDLLGDIQSVIHLNPEISDGALQLRMAEEELHSAQVASLTIDLGSLRAPHRVRAIKRPTLSRCFQPSDAPAGHIDGWRCGALREVDLGREYREPVVRSIGNQASTEPLDCQHSPVAHAL
jgi:hypothetical protein